MTNSKTLLSGLLALMLSVSSCSKDNGTQKDIQIDENNLTSCAPNSECQSFIYEKRDFSTTSPDLQTGVYRVFQKNVTTSVINSNLYIKVPMNANSFSLGKKDILNGQLKYNTWCLACLMAPSKVIGGFAKGISKKADQTKWIVEIQIIREIEANPAFRDTMYIKQYFDKSLIVN